MSKVLADPVEVDGKESVKCYESPHSVKSSMSGKMKYRINSNQQSTLMQAPHLTTGKGGRCKIVGPTQVVDHSKVGKINGKRNGESRKIIITTKR